MGKIQGDRDYEECFDEGNFTEESNVELYSLLPSESNSYKHRSVGNRSMLKRSCQSYGPMEMVNTKTLMP